MLLHIGDASGHSKALIEMYNVNVVSMPANKMSILEPMDLRVISTFSLFKKYIS